MTLPIPIQLAVEDDLSAAVLQKILDDSGRPYAVGTSYIGHGFGYLRRNIRGFNNAAKGTPWLVLTDLDKIECPPQLISTWLPDPCHPNLLFRVAVREVEAWLLADRIGFAGFLGIRRELVPLYADDVGDPKACLIDLARRSARRDLRADIVPPLGSTRQIGPNYNGRLVSFVQNRWRISVAAESSPSLRKTINAVASFVPTWTDGQSG
jgi:hypothetical protein